MDQLRITGAWTKAGIASCVRVQGATKYDEFLFDCGVLDSETLSAKFVLVTHGHMDHVGACIGHARAKALSGGPSTYYVPKDIIASLNEAKEAFAKMDNTTIPMNIIGVSPGDTFLVGSNLKVVVFPTVHRVPSQGYAIYSIKKGELLPEYQKLSKEEIAIIKRSGKSILSDCTEKLEIVYTGDTTFEGLLQPCNAFIFAAPIFITEITYLDGERAKAALWGHIHIDDIIENETLFQTEDQTLVFVHLSAKYSMSRALKLMREQIPSSLFSKVKVSLKSFGANEHLTRIDDSRWAQRETHQAGWGWATSNTISYNQHSSTSTSGSGHFNGGGNYRGSTSSSFNMTAKDQRYRKPRPVSSGATIASLGHLSTSSVDDVPPVVVRMNKQQQQPQVQFKRRK